MTSHILFGLLPTMGCAVAVLVVVGSALVPASGARRTQPTRAVPSLKAA